METIGKGGIFASYKTFPYYPQGCLIGQLLDESCVAAVCRMILQDDGIEIPEAYLRNILQTDELRNASKQHCTDFAKNESEKNL